MRRHNTIVIPLYGWCYYYTVVAFSPSSWSQKHKRKNCLFIKKSSDSVARLSSSVLDLFGGNKDSDLLGENEVLTKEKTDGYDVKKEKNNETLRFGGKQKYQSEELPLPEDTWRIYNFFSKKIHQHVLLTGGKLDSDIEYIQTNNLDPGLSERWVENASLLNGEKPSLDEDSVVKVTPTPIYIFNVKVSPETIIGSKLFFKHTSIDGLSTLHWVPEYQATLIQDYPRASGPKLLVWLFNKIVYDGKPPDDITTLTKQNNSQRDEKALLRVWVQPSVSGTFSFLAEAELWLEFKFPRLLLRFFPMSKDKAEEISSAAIVKALDLNLAPAIETFVALYKGFIEKTNTKDREV